MRHQRLALAAVLLLVPQLAAASGFGLFQHGGRATGQVGAFTARAADASAVTYNPAAITRVPGLQLQAGLDFNNANDRYRSSTGGFSSEHVITFPPALYLSWKPESSGWALGLGIDAPFWNNQNWQPVFFPGRFVTRQFKLQVFEVHPVLAYEMGEAWSIGGGVRYLYGTLEQGYNQLAVVPRPPGGTGTLAVEVESQADADVDALAWDLALHYARPAWGWGLVLRSAAELEGSGDIRHRPRDVPALPGVAEDLAQRFRDGGADQSFDLPSELRGGFWFAPYPELRIELDASYQRWSELDDTVITPTSFAPLGPGPRVTLRNWDDVVSLRLGLEGDITDSFALFGGVALEPSPVSGENVEPGFPRGDAMVYALGFSYNLPQLSFDVGYSFHDHDNRNAEDQEPLNPTVSSTYEARDQVWAASARWRF
jgi:long-chain fatty acid transport protein